MVNLQVSQLFQTNLIRYRDDVTKRVFFLFFSYHLPPLLLSCLFLFPSLHSPSPLFSLLVLFSFQFSISFSSFSFFPPYFLFSSYSLFSILLLFHRLICLPLLVLSVFSLLLPSYSPFSLSFWSGAHSYVFRV
jgi:hypothetical protein